jgi:hypothetical protein
MKYDVEEFSCCGCKTRKDSMFFRPSLVQTLFQDRKGEMVSKKVSTFLHKHRHEYSVSMISLNFD